jgi:hypothetical protein
MPTTGGEGTEEGASAAHVTYPNTASAENGISLDATFQAEESTPAPAARSESVIAGDIARALSDCENAGANTPLSRKRKYVSDLWNHGTLHRIPEAFRREVGDLTHICTYAEDSTSSPKEACNTLLKLFRNKSPCNGVAASWSTTVATNHHSQRHPTSKWAIDSTQKKNRKEAEVKNVLIDQGTADANVGELPKDAGDLTVLRFLLITTWFSTSLEDPLSQTITCLVFFFLFSSSFLLFSNFSIIFLSL